MNSKDYTDYAVEISYELPSKPAPRLRDIFELIETTSTTPTDTPKNVFQQIRIVVAGGNASLYAYDVTNNKWRAATLGT